MNNVNKDELLELLQKLDWGIPVEMGEKYTNWILSNETKIAELEKQNKHTFHYEPVVSIIVPTHNISEQCLCDKIESVLQQTYAKWELCIADGGNEQQYHIEEIIKRYACDCKKVPGKGNAVLHLAQGDYVGLLPCECTLTPFALYEVVKAINIYKEPAFVYAEVNKTDYTAKKSVTTSEPYMVRKNIYTCNFSVLKQSHVKGLYSDLDNSQDHDLILKAIENVNGVVYLPYKLFYPNPDKHVKRIWEVNQIRASKSEITANKNTREINSIKLNLRMARNKELEAFLSGNRHLNFSTPVSPKVTILLVLWNQAELTLLV